MNVAPFPNKRGWLDTCILSDGKNPKPLPVVANALIALQRRLHSMQRRPLIPCQMYAGQLVG